MMRRPQLTAAACLLGAGILVPPTPTAMHEFASWLVRPAMLPFAWSALAEARRNGDAAEMFARARQILQLLPRWTDGYCAFACNFAIDDGGLAVPAAQRAAPALRRLQLALAWLEDARKNAGQREHEVLLTMAFLPELAVRHEPGLAELLRPAGGPIAMADAYLAQAEVLRPHAAIREQRTFYGPQLAAGFLASGDRQRALLVLDTAIERSADVRDRALAEEWRDRLDEVRRWLRGDSAIDLEAVRQDPRLAALLPYLR